MIKFSFSKIFTIILFFISSSCGLKITNEISENVFVGSWTLDYVACYNSESESTIFEQYDFKSNNHDVVFQFEGRSFTYEVATASTPCTTTAYGVYNTDFNGDSKGNVDLSSITSGSSCDISIVDSGPNSVAGPTTVNMALLPSKSLDLYWLVDGSTMELELVSGFLGSVQNPGCQGLCFCKGFFLKN
jgi:hypothetical protein